MGMVPPRTHPPDGTIPTGLITEQTISTMSTPRCLTPTHPPAPPGSSPAQPTDLRTPRVPSSHSRIHVLHLRALPSNRPHLTACSGLRISSESKGMRLRRSAPRFVGALPRESTLTGFGAVTSPRASNDGDLGDETVPTRAVCREALHQSNAFCSRPPRRATVNPKSRGRRSPSQPSVTRTQRPRRNRRRERELSCREPLARATRHRAPPRSAARCIIAAVARGLHEPCNSR